MNKICHWYSLKCLCGNMIELNSLYDCEKKMIKSLFLRDAGNPIVMAKTY